MLCALLLLPFLAQAKEMKDFLPRDPQIFDIGSFIGEKTERYLRQGATWVVAVEPQPSTLVHLRNKFMNEPRVTIVPMAISDQEGTASFYMCDCPVLSSISKDWQKKGRFVNQRWSQPIEVQVTTLDRLIQEFGVPDFCKIDVENYELHVLKGLSSPIPYLSFEFAAEFLHENTKLCLEYLANLGYRQFNVCYGHSETFALDQWVSAESLFMILTNNQFSSYNDPLSWGDIYARFP